MMKITAIPVFVDMAFLNAEFLFSRIRANSCPDVQHGTAI
jgi:hypothetical protein